MGTSQSSNGSPSGVPLVPPWVPDIDQEQDRNDGDSQAPRGRFSGVKRNLTSFVENGSRASLQRALGQYVRKGYGGSNSAVSRFGGTAATGSALYSALSQISSDDVTQGDFNIQDLSNKSTDEIKDILIETVRPIDGSLDTEKSRTAIGMAFSELLNDDENVDIQNLDEEKRLFIVERFISYDIASHFIGDVGKHLESKAGSVTTYIQRLEEIKEYIKEDVSRAFREVSIGSHQVNRDFLTTTFKGVLENTFIVFESYLS